MTVFGSSSLGSGLSVRGEFWRFGETFSLFGEKFIASTCSLRNILRCGSGVSVHCRGIFGAKANVSMLKGFVVGSGLSIRQKVRLGKELSVF